MLHSKGLRETCQAAWSVILRNQKYECEPTVDYIEPPTPCPAPEDAFECADCGEQLGVTCKTLHARVGPAVARNVCRTRLLVVCSGSNTIAELDLETGGEPVHCTAQMPRRCQGRVAAHMCRPSSGACHLSHAPAGAVVGQHYAGRAEPSYGRCVHSCTAPSLTHCRLPASPVFHGLAQQCGKRHSYMPPGGVLEQQLSSPSRPS